MRPGETLIEMARRHVAEAEGHVRKQRDLVARMTAGGLETAVAEDLLREFEAALADHRASTARIEAEQQAGRRDAAGDIIPGATPL